MKIQPGIWYISDKYLSQKSQYQENENDLKY